MLRRGQEKLRPISVGDAVRIPVPSVDRGPATPRNVIGLVLEEPKPNLYRVGTQGGMLKNLLSRSQMECAGATFLSRDQIPQKEVSIREAATAETFDKQSQGYLRCACTGQCKTDRCSCKASKISCNSRCHRGNKCSNMQ